MGQANIWYAEGQAEDLDAEVNGIAGEVALRPAPIAVLDDEARISGQSKIACIVCDELESALLEQRREGGQSGGADLLAGPAGGVRRGVHIGWVGHPPSLKLRRDIAVFPPMGLDEHMVDLFEVGNAGLVAHRLDQ